MASQNRNFGSMLSRYVSQGSAEKQNQQRIYAERYEVIYFEEFDQPVMGASEPYMWNKQ